MIAKSVVRLNAIIMAINLIPLIQFEITRIIKIILDLFNRSISGLPSEADQL